MKDQGSITQYIWPWITGSIALASIDILFGSWYSVLSSPLSHLVSLFYVPAFFLLIALITALPVMAVPLIRHGAVGTKEGMQAAGAALFFSVCITVIAVLVLLDAESTRRLISNRWFPVAAVVSVIAMFVVSRLLFRKDAERGRIACSLTAATVSSYVFFRILMILKDSPSLVMSSVRGVIVCAVFIFALFLVFLLIRRLISGLSSISFMRKSPGRMRPAVWIAVAVAADILLCTLIIEYHEPRPTSSTTVGRLPNVILIVMDTTRADRLSCLDEKAPPTPSIDGLAAGGILFEHAVSAAPWTIPSHASIFTGTYSLTHGANWRKPRLDGRLLTLAEVLSGMGYRTYGFSNNPGVGTGTGFSRGFDIFTDVWRKKSRYPSMYARARYWLLFMMKYEDAGARKTNEMISRLLERERTQPVFLFVNYIEPHLRYRPPHPYIDIYAGSGETVEKMVQLGFKTLYDLLAGKASISDDEWNILSKLYDAETAYLDSRIGELMRELKSFGLFENSIIILTSDHGENIGDHDLIDHQFSIHETLLRVPLIIRYPALFAEGRRVDSPVQTLDIFQTVVSMIACLDSTSRNGTTNDIIERALSQAQGVDLTKVTGGEVGRSYVFSEYYPCGKYLKVLKSRNPDVDFPSLLSEDLSALTVGKHKLVRSSGGSRLLFDLGTDPHELKDIAGEYPSMVDSLDHILSVWTSSLPRGTPEGDTLKSGVDPETRRMLKDLGYLVD